MTISPPKSTIGRAIAGAKVYAATNDSEFELTKRPSADALITLSSSAKYYMKKPSTVGLKPTDQSIVKSMSRGSNILTGISIKILLIR